MSWIGSNTKDEKPYSMAINANKPFGPKTLCYSMKRIGIILKGRAAKRTITMGSNSSLFTVGAQVTLQAGGNLIMEKGSKYAITALRLTGPGFTYQRYFK